jgi:hypothetical protein
MIGQRLRAQLPPYPRDATVGSLTCGPLRAAQGRSGFRTIGWLRGRRRAGEDGQHAADGEDKMDDAVGVDDSERNTTLDRPPVCGLRLACTSGSGCGTVATYRVRPNS